MLKRLFVIGYPGDVGGANTELWHTLKMFRKAGLAVTVIPTWKPTARWKARLDGIGCQTVVTTPRDLQGVCGLPGGVVLSMCNSKFGAKATRLKDLGCRIVYLPCMCWWFPWERLLYRRHGTFDRYVFQSEYQRRELEPFLGKYGYTTDHGVTIHGAFDPTEFPYRPRPHTNGDRFAVGRLSRSYGQPGDVPAVEKYPRPMWPQYAAMMDRPLRVRVQGWNKHVANRRGQPPEWAECLPDNTESAGEFLSTLHAMVPGLACCAENWPRVGLEAMASGVPLVVEDKGGWREMIRNGETGLLCESVQQQTEYVSHMARNESYRLRIAERARAVLEAELANEDGIWKQWTKLLDSLN